jgi:peptidoglycan/LPS O-acetylase OafA/YrhL
MIYRPEIDGLRAVSVVSVVLFHGGFKFAGGGFVGVDVFFVISGFLITSILLDDLSKGQFNLWQFYERRARRILPALFFVILCCLPFAWNWLLPNELLFFFRSVISAVFFFSNIFFAHGGGYFDPAASENPLLHTWSLSVEEQFYLVFPVFLFLLWRFGRAHLFWVLLGVALISLVYSEIASHSLPVQNFFRAVSRAWELLAGALTAFVIQRFSISG